MSRLVFRNQLEAALEAAELANLACGYSFRYVSSSWRKPRASPKTGKLVRPVFVLDVCLPRVYSVSG